MGVLLLAALGGVLQEEASGLVFSTPRGWTRRTDEASRLTTFVPGGARDAQLLLYPASQAPLGSGPEFHALIVKSLKVEGPSTSGQTGLFQWTRAKLNSGVRVAAYTAKAGESYGAAVFLASEKDFDELLPAVEGMLREARFAGTPIHGLVFPALEGWTRKDDPSGSVVLSPPPPRGPLEPRWDYVMHVLASRPLLGTFWETHRKLHEDVVKASGLRDPVPAILEPNGPGPFIKSSTAGRDAGGAIRPLTLYSALSDGKIECVLVAHQEDVETIGALLSLVTVKAPPKDVAKTKIVEAYRRVDATIQIGPSSVQVERIWLRADGVADFSTTYPEGYAVSRTPAKLDASLLNGRVGAWKAVGEAVRVTRRAGTPPEVYARENGKLRLGDQVWQPMPSVDGLSLDGRWILPVPAGQEVARIAFTAQGRFQDAGVLAHVGALPVLKHAGSKEFYWPKPPARGAGTYEIRDFTLLVQYDDGTAWATDVSTLGDDPKDHSGLLLRTHVLRKDP